MRDVKDSQHGLVINKRFLLRKRVSERIRITIERGVEVMRYDGFRNVTERAISVFLL